MFKDGLLRGWRILVTGGGTGLGKGMVEKFLALGADIFICGRRKAVCDATAAELTGKYDGRVKSYGVDIRDAGAVDAMVADIFQSGPLTDLVNNAAGNFISRTEDLSTRGFDAVANTSCCTGPSMSPTRSAAAGSPAGIAATSCRSS